LHLSEDFKALKTRRLVEVGGDSAGGSARGKEIGIGLDIWKIRQSVTVCLACAIL